MLADPACLKEAAGRHFEANTPPQVPAPGTAACAASPPCLTGYPASPLSSPLLCHPQCTAGQSDSTDWSCKAESEAAAAAGASCPTFTDTSCSGIFAQPPEEGRRTAAYLASLLADMAYEPVNGATWEDTARTILPGWGATDVQFISKTQADQVRNAQQWFVLRIGRRAGWQGSLTWKVSSCNRGGMC